MKKRKKSISVKGQCVPRPCGKPELEGDQGPKEVRAVVTGRARRSVGLVVKSSYSEPFKLSVRHVKKNCIFPKENGKSQLIFKGEDIMTRIVF